jgi:hypothetical protein
VRHSSRVAARASRLLPLLATACGYPTFAFVEGDDASLGGPHEGADALDVLETTAGNAVIDVAAVDDGAVDDAAIDAVVVDTAADVTGDADAAPEPCAAPKVLCGGLCIDPSDDPRACGGCGRPACALGSTCVSGACRAPASCGEIRTRFPDLPSGSYQLGSGLARCEMQADGGGWTLVMKIDGAKSTFAYASSLWTDDAVLNPDAVELDRTEHKNGAFASVPFSAIRLGVVDGGVTRTAVLSQSGTSLRALFSGGKRATSLGRAKWLSLFASPSLQPNCNDEGFNLYHWSGNYQIRLGIAGNEQNDCGSPDSFIGFGATVFACGETGITMGNFALVSCGGVTADRRTRAFGHLWIR